MSKKGSSSQKKGAVRSGLSGFLKEELKQMEPEAVSPPVFIPATAEPMPVAAGASLPPKSAETLRDEKVEPEEAKGEPEPPAPARVVEEVAPASPPAVETPARAVAPPLAARPSEQERVLPTTEPRKPGSHELTESVSTQEGGPASEPLYRRLERKEVRFRVDQIEGLTRLARRLSRARRGQPGAETAERLTENTLVRVAVDLLLEHADSLQGMDESSLLAVLKHAIMK